MSVAACDRSVTSPRDQEVALLSFDRAATMDSVSMVPRGPFMDNAPPDSIKLTAAQQAAIKALHDAFAAAHATQFAQLKAIHDEAIAAHKAGKTRADIVTILQKAKPIRESMRADFEALRTKIEAILTPAQKTWAAAHHRGGGGPMGMPFGGMPGRP